MSGRTKPTPLYGRGDRVVRESSPDVIGEILSDPEWDCGDWWYAVRFARMRANVPEFELVSPPEEGEQVESIAMQGRWGKLSALRRAVAVERILKQNRSTVYSFNAHRIQFLPHQYRPLLKVLESEDRRLLIADEVGLGKTIEAGLILSELEARQKLDRVLVICPSRLREKWRGEMERKFRQEFDIWGSEQVREFVDRVQRNPRRAGFKAIASIQMLRRKELLDNFLGVVPDIDLLVFDEAHHARNRNTSTFEMVEKLARRCDGFLMLTATPLHLGTDDLFHLLQLLREGDFRDSFAFGESIRRNEGIVFAQRVVRARSAERLGEAAKQIRAHGGLLGESTPSDPLVAEVLQTLEHDYPEKEEDWIDMERLLEHAHFLSNVFTRTKKRDVSESTPIRKGHWIRVKWTSGEQDAYCRLVGFDPDRPIEEQTSSFGRSQRARQAASSVHGTILYKMPRVKEQLATELSDLEEDSPFEDDAVTMALPSVDSKYNKFKEVIDGLLGEEQSRKILVFTFFIGTSHYLADRLNHDGIETLRIGGDVPSNPRKPDRDERGKIIKQFRDSDRSRVLISTEVGSEGLDFQFCSCIVNYDLPWNPMVVEQRIGRIDRFGQKAEVLQIFSLVVENTIEDRILQRLYDRIGLFERAIGDLESILGEEVDELRRDYFSGRLTASELERKAEEKGRIIAKREHDARELEEEAEKLVGNGDYIREEVRKVRRLGRYVTPVQIQTVIEGFLETHHPDIQVQHMKEGMFRLRLTDRLLQDVEDAADPGDQWSMELRMRSRDGYLSATTDGERAYVDDHLDLLNASHPLVRTAARSMEGLLREPVARVGSVRLDRDVVEGEFELGLYFLAVFTLNILGVRPRRLMDVVAVRSGVGSPVSGDLAERLLYLCMEGGQEHPERDRLPSMPAEVWRLLLSAARSRKKAHQEKEERTNRSLYERRRQLFEDERSRKLRSAEQRLKTVQLRDRGPAIVELAKSQIDVVEKNYRTRLEDLEAGRNVQVELLLPPTACCVVEII